MSRTDHGSLTSATAGWDKPVGARRFDGSKREARIMRCHSTTAAGRLASMGDARLVIRV